MISPFEEKQIREKVFYGLSSFGWMQEFQMNLRFLLTLTLK